MSKLIKNINIYLTFVGVVGRNIAGYVRVGRNIAGYVGIPPLYPSMV